MAKTKILWRVGGKPVAFTEDGMISIGKTKPGTDKPWLLTYPIGFGGGQEERRFTSQRTALAFLNSPMFGNSKFVVRSKKREEHGQQS